MSLHISKRNRILQTRDTDCVSILYMCLRWGICSGWEEDKYFLGVKVGTL